MNLNLTKEELIFLKEYCSVFSVNSSEKFMKKYSYQEQNKIQNQILKKIKKEMKK